MKETILEGVYMITQQELDAVREALVLAGSDIWQTARVSEYNLTGKDPDFPDDPPDVPLFPKFVHRSGLDASYRVFDQVRETLKMLSTKVPTTSSLPGS